MKNFYQQKINLILISQIIPFCAVAQSQKSNSSELPNIVYILADDMGYGDVSCYNENSKIKTPNIDKLASEGISFTDAHTSSSVCTPTRYGILTGRYNWRSVMKRGVLLGYSKALIEPERIKQIKLDQLKKAARNSNPKSPFLIDILQEAEGDGCTACFI